MLKYLFCIFVMVTFGECQQCDEGYDLVGGKCFKPHYNTDEPWAAAEELCRLDDATLAIIDDCSLFGDLVRYLHVNGYEATNGYWIGATDVKTEGEWLWTNGNIVPLKVPFWGINEPNGGTDQNCARLLKSDQYYFHDETCFYSFNSPLCQKDPISNSLKEKMDDSNTVGRIIKSFDMKRDEGLMVKDQNPKAGTCANGFVLIRDSCFYFQKDTVVTWQNAVLFCQSLSARLAVLKDCNLFFDLVSYMNNNTDTIGGPFYWIGANDENEEGSWSWLDSTPVVRGPPFWGNKTGLRQPTCDSTRNCATLYIVDEYRFGDESCDANVYSLCQQDPIE